MRFRVHHVHKSNMKNCTQFLCTQITYLLFHGEQPNLKCTWDALLDPSGGHHVFFYMTKKWLRVVHDCASNDNLHIASFLHRSGIVQRHRPSFLISGPANDKQQHLLNPHIHKHVHLGQFCTVQEWKIKWHFENWWMLENHFEKLYIRTVRCYVYIMLCT